jgi:2-polyprenyl-3-methyl-5-hydroxy-6-metoxy-1,4-benzoquinol methylase
MTTSIQTPVTSQRLLQFSWAFAIPLIIDAAVRNRLFDALAGGPKAADALAAETGVSERGARAALNALTSVELLSKDAEGRYALTPESAAYLVTTSPSFMGGMFRHTSSQLMPRWLQLKEVIRTGRPAPYAGSEAHGPAHFRELVEDIMPLSLPAARALAAELIGEASEARVLDIGAGSGVWGAALAQRSKRVRVTAMDWPEVTEVTLSFAERFGVARQIETLNGDMFEVDFGAGYQIAVLGQILHSFSEARNRALLEKIHAALAPGATLAIAEFLPDEARATKTQALIFAVNMLVNTNEGGTYTYSEIAAWLKEAGFENVRTLEAPGPSPLILADRGP